MSSPVIPSVAVVPSTSPSTAVFYDGRQSDSISPGKGHPSHGPKLVAPKKDNRLRVAITTELQPSCLPHLSFVEPGQGLAALVQEACTNWNFAPLSDYGLKRVPEAGAEYYLTDETWHELRTKDQLKLSYSISNLCSSITSTLTDQNSSYSAVVNALACLAGVAADHSFAKAFCSAGGFTVLLKAVEQCSLRDEGLTNLLRSYADFGDYLGSWDDACSTEAVKSLAQLVGPATKMVVPAKATEIALSLLDSIVTTSTQHRSTVQQCVNVEGLINHLHSSDPALRLQTLCLMNALFHRASGGDRTRIAQILRSKSMVATVSASVFPITSSKISHQMLRLQQFQLNMYKVRLQGGRDAQVQAGLNELRNIAFSSPSATPELPSQADRQSSATSADWKSLGFLGEPLQLFSAEPGLLTLDCLLHLARRHTDHFMAPLIENACRNIDIDRQCPLAHMASCVVSMLIEHLHLKDAPPETPTSEAKIFEFLFNEMPFEETFVVVMRLLYKTWAEMRATRADEPKVLAVLREQIVHALNAKPASLQVLWEVMSRYPYGAVKDKWSQEQADRQQQEYQAPAIKQLREHLKEELIEVVKSNRIARLREGQTFPIIKPGNRFGRKRVVFVKLTTLQGDVGAEGSSDTYEDVLEWASLDPTEYTTLGRGKPRESITKINKDDIRRVAVARIATVLTGSDSTKSGKSDKPLMFTIRTHDNETHPFLAPDQSVFDVWTDGINCLSGNDMVSESYHRDLTMLLEQEVKIRLLDLDSARIQPPSEPPPVPPLPDNFTFAYADISHYSR